MSFWFYGRRRSGGRSLYSVHVSVLLVTFLLALAIGVVLPWLAWLLGS